MRQGRVTLPCESLRGVRAPNTFAACLVKLKVMLSMGFSLSKILFSKTFLKNISKSHGSLHPVVGAARIIAEKVFLILALSSRA